VSKINSKTQNNLDLLITKAFQYSKNNEVIIESYMDGYECTVETFTDKGITTILAITEKLKVDNTDGLIASELRTFNRESRLYNEISNLIIKTIKIMGFNYGPCHSEVIVMKSGEIGIVEIGARGGGFLVFNSLVPLVSGINIAKLTILQSIGMEIKIGKVEKNHAILKFIIPKNGRIKSISGFDKINEIEGISAQSFVKIGDNVKFSESDGDRLGYILSSDKIYDHAEKLIINNENLIKFVYDN
jgi:phosphoribosylamine-glycine ligase